MDRLDMPGKQIVLRDWRHEDLERYRASHEPGRTWQAFDGPYMPRPDATERERRLARISARIDEGDWTCPRVVAAVADLHTNELVGQVSRYWQSEETHWLSLGVVVFESANWGRGFGYEALGIWSQYLFDALPELARLDLRTWSGNPD